MRNYTPIISFHYNYELLRPFSTKVFIFNFNYHYDYDRCMDLAIGANSGFC